MFFMNAAGVNFTNNETNPTRSWFKRMVDQLEINTYNAGFDWNMAEMSIAMHSNLWNCISHLYAYHSYYDNSKIMNKNVYQTIYTNHVQMRHEEYLTRKMLPVGGRFYPIILDNEVSGIDFITHIPGQSRDNCQKFSGCIQNICCYTDIEDRNNG